MKKIILVDTTLAKANSFSFKEKIEIAKNLDKLCVDAVEIAEIENAKADILFVKTLSSFINKSVISVTCSKNTDSIDNAVKALCGAKNPRIKIEMPISPVGMEYTCHKKAPKMLAFIEEMVSYAKKFCADVEFSAVDATRADDGFLNQCVATAVKAGATSVTICDNACVLMPDDFANLVEKIVKETNVSVGVYCDNKNGLASASAMLSIKKGATTVKTTVDKSCIQLENVSNIIKDCGDSYKITTQVKQTELSRTIKQIARIIGEEKTISSTSTISSEEFYLSSADEQAVIEQAVTKLGYELSQEDNSKVYEEFLKVASKKKVGAKELEAIVANVALQVPATYKVISYVINNGNIISSSAQITLEKNGEKIQGICIGDGPIDAAFRAIDSIIGVHYELDGFQISAVTEGKEAMGSAVVKLRSEGKLYSGNGISTDIIGASIKAYVGAINKIAYEEAQK